MYCIVQFLPAFVEYMTSDLSELIEQSLNLSGEAFAQALQELSSLGVETNLGHFLGRVMEDASNNQIEMLVQQWGTDVAFGVMDWGMFWQRCIDPALPYFEQLSDEEQKTLVYQAAAEGYVQVVKRGAPKLEVTDHCALISENYSIRPEVSQVVYASCNPVDVMEILRANGLQMAAQWVEDMHRPVYEKGLLEEATASTGRAVERKKI